MDIFAAQPVELLAGIQKNANIVMLLKGRNHNG